MILTLSVHPSRVPDLLSWDRMMFDPPIPANTYHDSFGNFCHVIRAPAGRLTMSTDFLVQDNGEPDPVAPQAQQHDLGDLPVEVLIYLLGSRYCETDRLSDTAWALFGQVPKGWPLVQAICDYVHDRITFGYAAREPDQDGLGCPRGAARRVPRLRPSRRHAVPLHEHPGALLHRLSRRYRRAGRSGADGFQRLVRSLSRRPLVHVRCPPQHPRIGRILMARGRDATDVAILTSFGPCTLAGFKVVTEEVKEVAAMPA